MGFASRLATEARMGNRRWQQLRNFSSSSLRRKNGPLIAFPQTSSPELDDIVKTFRETVFFPNHISKVDREMIYTPSKHIYLTGEEPVKVKVPIEPAIPRIKPRKPKDKDASTKKGGENDQKLVRATAPAIYPQKKPIPPRETFIMNPLTIVGDRPKLRSNYRRMLQLMSEPSDFAIIPGFLRELNLTRMKASPEMLARTVRRAAELDSLDVIMHAFQRVDTVGLRINHPEIITQLMQAIVRHAANGYWTQKRLDRALAYCDSVLLMLQDPRHRSSSATGDSEDALQLPMVWGTAMALGSIRQLRYGPREVSPHRYDLQALTHGFAERLDLGRLGSESFPGKVQNMWLANWAPAIVGTKYAIQALGSDNPAAMKLQIALSAMDEAAAKAAAKVVEEFPDASGEKLGLKMTSIMETALDVEAPASFVDEETIVAQSDPEAAQSEEPEDLEGRAAAEDSSEPVIDEPDAPTEKKDTV